MPRPRRAPLILIAMATLTAAGCDGGDTDAPAPAAGPAPVGQTPAEQAPPASDPAEPDTPEPTEAGTSGPLPLRPGVYVTAGSGCASPPNAGFRVYDGRGFSGSATRGCRATVTSVEGADHQVENSCVDTYSGDRTTTGQTVRIEGPDSFRLTEAGEGASQTFRLCSAGEAPDYLEDLAR